jgi:hypothetical protein
MLEREPGFGERRYERRLGLRSTGEAAVLDHHEAAAGREHASNLEQASVGVLPVVEGVEGQHHVGQRVLDRQPLGGAHAVLDARPSRIGRRALDRDLDHSLDGVDADQPPGGDPRRGVSERRPGAAADVDDGRVCREVERVDRKSIGRVLAVFIGVPLGSLCIPRAHIEQLTLQNESQQRNCRSTTDRKVNCATKASKGSRARQGCARGAPPFWRTRGCQPRARFQTSRMCPVSTLPIAAIGRGGWSIHRLRWPHPALSSCPSRP